MSRLARIVNGQTTDIYDASGRDDPLELAAELAHDECAIKLGVYEPGDGHREITQRFVVPARTGYWYKLGPDTIQYLVQLGDTDKEQES